MNKINFITSNQGKINSLQRALKVKNLDVEIVARNLDIMEPQFDTVQEVSKFKALRAFDLLHEPVLVEDGGLAVDGLKGFPGVYTKYVLKTVGADGIISLLRGNSNRDARFISVATFIDSQGNVFQFERDGGNVKISEQKSSVKSPFSWSELWNIVFLSEFEKNMCELSEQELNDYYACQDCGSVEKFVNWFACKKEF